MIHTQHQSAADSYTYSYVSALISAWCEMVIHADLCARRAAFYTPRGNALFKVSL